MKKILNITSEALVMFLCGLLVFPPQLVFAQAPVASGATNTTVTSARNDVPVVNIAAPSSAGLSHNTFTSYNVGANGLVLNNGDVSQLFRQSQLAGQVAGNQNLAAGNQARIILNEVTGSNRSTLVGFTEVLCGKADLIVANPFGITFNGGGFINTDRVSLVTGTPNITGGVLGGFNVRGGDILISGTGINASSQQMLDLVSRRITVDGQVNAPILNIVAGANNWNYATGATTAIASDGSAAPTYAIDSSVLGGMYAGRISLKATEAGTGVRMLGNAAATADDFTISSAGKIEVRSKLSAARDLSLTSSSAGADAIKTVDASITAGRNLALAAGNGGATLIGGSIVATGELSYALGSLTDTASTTAGIADANKRYGATVQLNGSGAWAIDGVSYGADSALAITAGSFSVGSASHATIYSNGTLALASQGHLGVNDATLNSVGDMSLTSGTDTAIASTAKIRSTGGNITLNAEAGLANAGIISADNGNLTVSANAASGDITNSGTMYAKGLADVSGDDVAITGKLLAGIVNMKADALSVTAGGDLESSGDMTLDLNHLTIGGASDSSSRILAATSGIGSGSITSAGTLNNYGVLHSGSDLDVSASAITNAKTGAISAQQNLNVSATNGDLINWGALYAGQDLSASASGLLRNVADETSNWGTIDAGRDMTFAASEFLNESTISAAGNITITSPKFRNEVHDGAVIWGPESTHITVTVLGRDVWKWMTVEHEDSYTTTWNKTQSYRAGVLFRPRIIAGGTLLTRQFDTGMNMGGYLSGDTVTLSGNGPGATFTNDAMTLVRRDFTDVLIQKFSTTMMPPLGLIPITPTSCTNYDYPATSQDTTLASQGASIRANTLNASGFSLVNDGTPLGPAVTPKSATGTTFQGLPLNLPANPNGMFVSAKNPNSRYLVESNPLYTNVDNYLGSDYLAQKYNLNTNKIVKRLGDAAYETSLVRQQLLSQAGTNTLKGYTSEKEQMRGLMDHAGTQAASLGLKYGQALTSDQQKNLKGDMVWMVETTVNGQKVLAPVVYLAASTKAMFEPGNAVIAADKTNMNLTSLTNTGGTISGASSLNITTQGDIKNVSGTIKGGNVSLSSTEGSILSQTYTQTNGGPDLQKTTVGQQAGIVATGTLSLDAAKDITNLGAKMAAGGDATLSAGGNITFDTVEKKEATTTLDLSEGSKISTVRTTDQLKSKLSSGGTLTVTSKGDITLAGTSVVAAKDALLDAGGNLNLLARENTREEITDVSKTSIGKNGSLWSREDTRTDVFKSRNVGTTITTTGNAVLSANKDVTIQGSDVKAKGDIAISGEDVKVLAGKDLDRTTTTTNTISLLSITSGGDSTYTAEASADASAEASASLQGVGAAEAGAKAGANAKAGVVVPGMDDSFAGKDLEDLSKTASQSEADAETGIKSSTGASASANAKASAEARANMDAGGLDQYKVVVTQKEDEKVKVVGSSLSSGKNLTITARKTATLQGAKVNAKGDIELTGQDVKILAAEDRHTVTENTTSTKQGVYLNSDNKVKVDAKLNGDVSAGLTSGHKEEIGGDVSGSVSSANTIDLMRDATTQTNTVDTKNVGTKLSSGGNLKIASGNTLTVQGSELSGKQGVELQAREMEFLAGKDSHSTSTTTVENRMGLYVDANAKANAQAGANGNYGPLGTGAGANAGAGAAAEVSGGVQIRTTISDETERTTKARVSTIKSGSGSITRKAENSITDVGTSIEAAGDFTQTATTFTSKAAADTTEKSSSSTSQAAKLGVYGGAGANAEAGAGASAGLGATAKAEADAKASIAGGAKATLSVDMSSSKETTSTAVASSIKAGGKAKSVTTDKTSLEGTQISGGSAVELEAGSLDYAAAKDTETKSGTSFSGNLSGKIGAGLSATTAVTVDAELAGDVKGGSTSERSSTAVVGGITSDGGISIKTKGDTRLEGTELNSAGDTEIAAGGNLTLAAARDTSQKSEMGGEGSISLTTSKGKNSLGVGAEGSASYGQSSSESSTVHVNTDDDGNTIKNITTGGSLKLSAGKTVTLEGTTIDTTGNAVISGDEGVNYTAARDTSTSQQFGVNAGLKLAGGTEKEDQSTKNSGSAEGSFGFKESGSNQSTANAGKLTTGGNLEINSKNRDVTLEGTELEAGGKARIAAGGSVNLKAAESTSESSGFDINLSGKGSVETTKKSPGGESGAAKPPAESVNPSTDAGKNPGTGGTQGSNGSKQGDEDLSKWQDKNAALMKELKEKKSGGGAEKNNSAGKPGGTSDSDKGSTSTAETTGNGKKTETSGKAGLNIQSQRSSKKSGGSIKAGAGGVEISAGGGDVTMEGTKIATSGDADISASRNVNITAAKNTESAFGLSLAATATVNTKTPTSPKAKPPAAPSGQATSSSTDKSAPDTSKTKNPDTGGTPGSDGSKKTPGSGTAQELDNKKKKATPAVEKQGEQTSLVKGVEEKKAEEDSFSDNMKGATGSVGITMGSAVTGSQQSDISTGGKLTITSGEKTTLTDTKVKAAGGQEIQAVGGADRKIP